MRGPPPRPQQSERRHESPPLCTQWTSSPSAPPPPQNPAAASLRQDPRSHGPELRTKNKADVVPAAAADHRGPPHTITPPPPPGCLRHPACRTPTSTTSGPGDSATHQNSARVGRASDNAHPRRSRRAGGRSSRAMALQRVFSSTLPHTRGPTARNATRSGAAWRAWPTRRGWEARIGFERLSR